MPGESPSAGPPYKMMFIRRASGSGFMRRPSVRSEGLVAKPAAEGPSPRPPSPWHTAQDRAKSSRPASTSRGAGAAALQASHAAPTRRDNEAAAVAIQRVSTISPATRLLPDLLLSALQIEVSH